MRPLRLKTTEEFLKEETERALVDNHEWLEAAIETCCQNETYQDLLADCLNRAYGRYQRLCHLEDFQFEIADFAEVYDLRERIGSFMDWLSSRITYGCCEDDPQ